MRAHKIRGALGPSRPTSTIPKETEMTTQNNSDRPKSNRGFASMDSSKQREIASKGGKAAHAQGRAHEFTADEARTAGRKGGEVVSRDRAHMAAIGRAGGQARGRNRAMQAAREAAQRAETSPANSQTVPTPAE
jgi:general stress protein YciG